MRIGVDIRTLLSPTGRGVSHYAHAILAELIRQHPRDEWHLLQTGRHPYRPAAEHQGRRVHHHHFGRSNKLLNARLALTGRPALDSLLPPVDVLFAPNLGFINPGRTPLVVTVHDLSYELFPELYRVKERLWHRMVNPRRLLDRAARIIAVSGQTKDELGTVYGIPDEKVSVVHSGIDAAYRSVTARDGAAVRRKYQLPERYLLFVGAHDPRKRLPVLVEAFALARRRGLQADLVLAGSTSPALHRLVRESDNPAIRVLGYLPEADKPGLYAEAEACVLVSSHEGFGFPPLEALATGTPAIVSDLPVFKETMGDAALTVPLDNPAALAQKLVDLEAGRARLAKAAAQRALRRLTWANAARQTYDVLKHAAR